MLRLDFSTKPIKELLSFPRQRLILATVPLGRRHEANAAVPMLMVVIGNKVTHPDPCSVKVHKTALRLDRR